MSDSTTSLAVERRAQELHVETFDLPPEALDSFLAARCGDDEALRATLAALLRVGAATPAALAPLPPAMLAALRAPPPRLMQGERPYRLLHELGRGGFGTVFLAERADGDDGERVAVKRLTLAASASRVARGRFRLERQICADPPLAAALDAVVLRARRPPARRLGRLLRRKGASPS